MQKQYSDVPDPTVEGTQAGMILAQRVLTAMQAEGVPPGKRGHYGRAYATALFVALQEALDAAAAIVAAPEAREA